MSWSKVDSSCRTFISPSVLKVEIRKEFIQENGNRLVKFIQSDTKDLSDSCIDPRKVNITTLILSGCTIPPGDFMNLMNISDMSDIEDIQNVQNEVLSDYIESNLDFIKSRLVNDESKEV